MGDFSRDPETRLQEAVANHYVGVRLQQGVPILDTDWNELEDLRRHELASLFQNYMGNGVPDLNDGFHVMNLSGGGAGNIVLQAAPVTEGVSSIAINFPQSTAASLLGFLPEMSASQRAGSNPAQLTGNAVGPFFLTNGLTLAIEANGEPVEVVTFLSADFVDITQATAAEVSAVLNASLANATVFIGAGNDFIIRGGDGSVAGAGRIIVQGAEAVNEMNLTYATQPLFNNPALALEWGVPQIPALTTPVANRQDLVYIDIWDREVNTAEDDQIMLQQVGIEATTRTRREWAVRVAEGVNDLAGIPRIPGHRYEQLALMRRPAGENPISELSIIDRRTRNLNVARYLKTPIFIERGVQVVDANRYATVLETFREILLTRFELQAFDFNAVGMNVFFLLMSLQDLAQHGGFAAIQVRAGNFNNHDGLQFLERLYALQTEFVRIVSDIGNVGNTADAFIQEYRDRLEGDPAQNIDGLRPALDAEDLILGVQAQEEINGWLSAPINILPEGDITITLVSVEPQTNLANGVPFNITYQIESNMTSPQTQEQIDVAIDTANPSTWLMALNQNAVTVNAAGGAATVIATVTPQAGTVSAVFELTATANRNPIVTRIQSSDPFNVGQPPPSDQFLQWVQPALDGSNQLVLSAGSLGGTTFFQVELINTSTTDTQIFEVSHFITAPIGEAGLWSPDAATPGSFTSGVIAASDSETVTLSFSGPATAAVGGAGTLTIQATLISEGGTNVVGGKTRILDIPFLVTA